MFGARIGQCFEGGGKNAKGFSDIMNLCGGKSAERTMFICRKTVAVDGGARTDEGQTEKVPKTTRIPNWKDLENLAHVVRGFLYCCFLYTIHSRWMKREKNRKNDVA